MTRDVLLATASDVLRGVMLTGLLVGLVLFHRAGMARVHRGGAHVARLRPGMRELTEPERRELRRRQQNLEAGAEQAWLSQVHQDRRRELCTYVAQLADDRVPLSHIAGAMGVSKQRAHQQAVAGRPVAL